MAEITTPAAAPAATPAPGQFHGEPGRFYPARNPEAAPTAADETRVDQVVAEATRKAGQTRNEQIQQRNAQDNEDRVAALNVIREKWGSEYQSKIHDIKQVLAGLPPEMADNVREARLANGTALFNHPPALEVFARLAEIRKLRMENRSAFMRDEAIRQEERDLITKIENAVNGR